ncbi:hypothetical protein AVEN_253512-1 [Araneus ventricosus]|uniref:Uncharacterized protein n=1 Tax=Araneus ventricosus TaxID=182803 RepID=A0A4Y2BUN0_ARAVE|nr:hypothetical protein AVEN_253512-1 [Araneus ventricosus]
MVRRREHHMSWHPSPLQTSKPHQREDGYPLFIGPFFFAETSVTANWTCCKVTQYPKCSIYNPLIPSNKMLGHGCAKDKMLELDYRLDILRATKGAHVKVH